MFDQWRLRYSVQCMCIHAAIVDVSHSMIDVDTVIMYTVYIHAAIVDVYHSMIDVDRVMM